LRDLIWQHDFDVPLGPDSSLCPPPPVAPEVTEEFKMSKAADLYSFGVIMWELYHGITAWQVRDPEGDYYYHATCSISRFVAYQIPRDFESGPLDQSCAIFPPPSTQYLVQVLGPQWKKELGSMRSHKLLSYRDDGLLPVYVELGRACLNEDPEQRPTFEEAYEALRELLAAFRANNDMMEDFPETPTDTTDLHRSQAKDWLRQCQQEVLERMRLIAESVRGTSGECLSVSECITCLSSHGSMLFKGMWDGKVEVAIREVLLVEGTWDNAERRSQLERALSSQSVPEHPNLVCWGIKYQSGCSGMFIMLVQMHKIPVVLDHLTPTYRFRPYTHPVGQMRPFRGSSG